MGNPRTVAASSSPRRSPSLSGTASPRQRNFVCPQCWLCVGRLLPHDFPKWKTVYHYFRQWRQSGIWQQVHERLRQWVRTTEYERAPSPSAGVVDSQSVKSGTLVSKEVGYDGGKQVRGRKRHVLVDTLGLLVVAVVTAANISEGSGLKTLLLRTRELQVNLQRLIVI